MNCNDFQAVLMANKSWIRKITCPPPRTHAHSRAHTQGHVSWHAVQGSFRSQMNKVLGYFLLLMSVLLTFIMQHGRGISRN